AMNVAVVQFEALYMDYLTQQEQGSSARSEDAGTLTLELGVVPDEGRELAQQLASRYTVSVRSLRDIATALKRLIADAQSLPERPQADLWVPVVRSTVARAGHNEVLLPAVAGAERPGVAASARWISPLDLANECGSYRQASSG